MFGSCAAFRYSVHCKKRLATFPSTAGYSRQGEFGKGDIPAEDGNVADLFFTAYAQMTGVAKEEIKGDVVIKHFTNQLGFRVCFEGEGVGISRPPPPYLFKGSLFSNVL
jgi:hypothetical protein